MVAQKMLALLKLNIFIAVQHLRREWVRTGGWGVGQMRTGGGGKKWSFLRTFFMDGP